MLQAVAVYASSSEPKRPVLLDAMTWKEVRDAVKDGVTTVIIPTGGIEQNGPHLALGKHNFNLDYTALAIATRLGNALAAPTIPYVPQGSISPPQGHMRFAGTVSVRDEMFAGLLEDIARSFKQHGFTLICFVGEHGASQPVQQRVAQVLSEEWKGEGVRVVHIDAYYDTEKNGQTAWLKTQGLKERNFMAHGGLADTAEMMAVSGIHKLAVRPERIKEYDPKEQDVTGVQDSPIGASLMIGAKLLELKVAAAVAQIRALQSVAH